MEVKDALDNFCHPLGVVAAGRGFVVYPGGIYSHPPRGRACGAAHPTDHGQKGGLTSDRRMRSIIWPPGEDLGGTTEYARNHGFEVNR